MALLAALAVALGSCGDDTVVGSTEGADADVGPMDTGAGGGDTADGAGPAQDVTAADAEVPDDVTEIAGDVTSTDASTICPVGQACPCASDADCASGQCLFDASGKGTCALPCDNGKCPEGQMCVPAKGDPSKSVCVPKPPCAPKDEVCNGQDDDCDGQTDEGLCYDGNPCTDDVCNADGQCTHPNNSLPCDDGNACTAGDGCAVGLCTSGTASACGDGLPCTQDGCDAKSGACTHDNLTGGCDDGSACTLNDSCDAGVCVAGKALACDDDNVCTDDSCDPAKGCVNLPNVATCTDSDPCTEKDLCNLGACKGGKLNCDDGTICTDDACKDGGCVHLAKEATCDDANDCTEADLCKDGACNGTAKDCDDGSPCTIDACEGGSCSHKQVPELSACDDKNPCTEKDVCDHDGICAGVNKICDDNNPCTVDACEKTTGGCKFEASQGLGCEDGNLCTLGDACVAGACASGASKQCVDGLVCTADSCDPAKGDCVFVPKAGPCDDNNPCTLADECTQGSCGPGSLKDCDDGDPCTVEKCLPASGQCDSNPSVAGISCEDGKLCTQGDACDGGKCVPGKIIACDDGNPCTNDACNPDTGKCASVNADGKSCTDGNTCTDGDICKAGTCVSGTVICACQSNLDCAPKEDGDLCNGTLFCNLTNHNCEVDKKTIVVCDPTKNTACITWGCNGAAGKCEPKNNPDGTACDADSSICTKDDACLAGLCVPGANVGCDDGNPCTNDACDPVGGCTHTNNDSTCNDGSACSQSDACANGKCIGGNYKVCNDANACTSDSCDPDTAACIFAKQTGSGCDDSNPCTLSDTCADGVCTPKSNVSCDDGKACTFDVCDTKTGKCTFTPVPDNVACDDNNKCTLNDFCSKGACQSGKQPACDDGSPCTADSCNLADGKCQNVPTNEAGPCTDGDACTVGDACKAGACISGKTTNCNTGNPCVLDKCDQTTGKCVAKLGTLACDDGNACSEGDACVNGTCTPAKVIFCDDGNPCTDDVCDTKTGNCIYTPNTAPCNDNTACTTKDVCAKGVCGGVALVCADSNPCTAEYCDAKSGCVYPATNQGAPCSDGNVCTTNDACSNGTCKGTGIVCSDGNPCTNDTCDPVLGCKFTAFVGPCNDGNPCTTGDVCTTGKCIPGAAVVCNDNNACTDDACNPGNGLCVSTNNDKNTCSDGNACTAGDFCSAGVCKAGPNPVSCDDKNTCTADWCDPLKSCQHQANPAVPCDDANPCTLKDICQSGSCQSGTWDLCDDANACTTDICDPKTGCAHVPNTLNCDDGNACVGPDACVSGKCVGKALIGCDDNNACTTNSCDTKTGCVFTPVPGGNITTTSFASGAKTLVSDTQGTGGSGPKFINFGPAAATAVAPFWTTIQGATWVWVTPTTTDPTKNHLCEFQQTFNVSSLSGITATLVVAADNNMACYVNDKPVVVSYAPNNYSTAKSISIKSALIVGDNVLKCDVENFGFPDATPSSNPGGLAFRIDVSTISGGAPCDDGNPCTSVDVCFAGACTGVVGQLCDDGDACTLDQCDLVKGCSNVPKDGLPCDDANPCTTFDKCLAGKCAPGSATACDDGMACTIDKCDKFAGCISSPASTGVPTVINVDSSTAVDITKQDGSKAKAAAAWDQYSGWTHDVPAVWIWSSTDVADPTKPETVIFTQTFTIGAGYQTLVGLLNIAVDGAWICELNGKLVGVETAENTYQTPVKISLAGKLQTGLNTWTCTVTNPGVPGSTAKTNPAGLVYRLNISAYTAGGAAACDDGNACTVGDWCQGPYCIAGAVSDCDDNNACTVDFCDPKSGCAHKPSGQTVCDDGNPCTVSDVCNGTQCVGGATSDCGDGNACTTDKCDAKLGCVNSNADGIACDDKNPCTIDDTCTSGKCSSSKANACDDSNPCSVDSCSPSQGCFHNVQNGGACDDGNTCTINDVCSGGLCLGTAQNGCSDGNACTTDACDGVKGCVSVPVASGPCEDGNPCTLNDGCKGATCAAGTPKPCNDSEPCTMDSCDQKTGNCVFAMMVDDTVCEDGNPCTVSDKCGGGKCKSGILRQCGDGNPCTDDACDPGTGNCVNTILVGNYACDDGDPCTESDLCNQGACIGKAKNCNDNNACTIDACNSGTGKCFYKAVVPCNP